MDVAIKPATRLWFPERDAPKPRARAACPIDALSIELADLESDGLLPPGSMLPRTRVQIRGRLGEGGGGTVYRGVHVDIKRTLAIKVQQDARPDARDSFLAEARAAVKIDSPHVVEVVDYGELPDGRAWYAMEYLRGRSLARVLDQDGPLPPMRAVSLLRMACRGLAATHAAGVVHCDVKPDNLIVRRRNGVEHLVIVDFGIALPLGESTATVCGTPEYMAPEQISGRVVDARTDVYSLGCCAFEMLTGNPVVTGEEPEQVLQAHMDGLAPRWPEHVPVPLREVIERCLATEGSDRYNDMQEVDAALCRALVAAGLSVPDLRADTSFSGGAPTMVLQPSSRARPRLWLALAAVGVLIFAAGSVQLVEEEPADTRVDIVSVTEPLVETPAPTQPAPRVQTAATAAPTVEPPSAPRPLLSIFATETPTPSPVAIADVPPAAPREPSPNAAIRAGQRALASGDRRAAEQAFTKALKLAPRNASALAGLSDVHFESGRHARALHFAQLAVKAAPRSAAHRIRLGDAYYRMGRRAEARQQYERGAALGSTVAQRRLGEVTR